MVTDLLEKVGSLWGDQREYLTCPEHGGEYPWDVNPEYDECPVAGCELHVHLPHAEQLSLHYLVWRGDQKWIPQRRYIDDLEGTCERVWYFMGREWFRRRVPSLFDGLDDA